MKLFARWKRPPQPPQETPQVQAARWLARRELGLLDTGEADGSVDERELSKFLSVLDHARGAAASPGINQMRAEALGHTPRSSLLLGNVPVFKAAAALVAVLVAGYLWMESGRSPGSPMLVGDFHETRKGERRTVRLDDGSVLTLNTDSRVQVVLTDERRKIRLLQGQAIFQVAPDRERPFSVIGGALEITALGTQFDVHVDRGRARVVLMEGRVKVEPASRHGLARFIPALERTYLKPGQQLTTGDGDRMVVSKADLEQSTSWQYGRLIFRGESLGSAIAEFNRYSDLQLAVSGDAAKLPVHGVFSTAHPRNFLAALSIFYPVHVEERSPQLMEIILDRP